MLWVYKQFMKLYEEKIIYFDGDFVRITAFRLKFPTKSKLIVNIWVIIMEIEICRSFSSSLQIEIDLCEYRL